MGNYFKFETDNISWKEKMQPVENGRYVLVSGSCRVFPEDLGICATALCACLPACFCQCVGGVGDKTVP